MHCFSRSFSSRCADWKLLSADVNSFIRRSLCTRRWRYDINTTNSAAEKLPLLSTEKPNCHWQTARHLGMPMLCCQKLPLMNDCDLLARICDSTVIHQRAVLDSILAWFSNFYLPLSHLTPSMVGIPWSYRVRIWLHHHSICCPTHWHRAAKSLVSSLQ